MPEVMSTLGKMLGALVLFGISKSIIFMPPIGTLVGLIFIVIAFMLLWASYTDIKTLFMSVVNGKAGFRDYDGNVNTKCPQTSKPDDYIDPGLVPQPRAAEFDTIHHVRKNTSYTKRSSVPKNNGNIKHTFPDGGNVKMQLPIPKKALNVARNATLDPVDMWTNDISSCNHQWASTPDDFGTYCKSRTVTKDGVRSDGPHSGK